MNNTNTETGIAFGYIAANDLDSELADTLMYGLQATDYSFKEALEQAIIEAKGAWEDDCDEKATAAAEAGTDYVPEEFEFSNDEFGDKYSCDEPIIGGVHEGVTYQSSWLGGALHFFIFHSPVITHTAKQASPCVPGAGILPSGEGSETCYDVPYDWLHDHG